MSVKVFTIRALDLDRYIEMQRESSRELLEPFHVSNSFISASFYRWKYTPPTGDAKIAIVYDGEDMVASNVMFPLTIKCSSIEVTGWQSCDTRTLLKVRRKGRFYACLQALKAELHTNEIFFGYPNQNSMGGFIKFGWKKFQLVPTFINPLAMMCGRSFQQVRNVNLFDGSLDVFAERLSKEGKSHIKRDAAYLNWRYTDCPVYQYFKFVWDEGGETLGVLVLRSANIMGKKFALIMELLGLTPTIEQSLFKVAQRWAREQRLLHIIMMSNRIGPFRAFTSGYFYIPSKFLTNQKILMGNDTGGDATKVLHNPWTVQLGDWDGF